MPGLLMNLMFPCVENIQWTVSATSCNPEASKRNKMYPKSPTALHLTISKQKINLTNGQMAKETRYDFSMGLLMRIIFKLFSLIASGFLLFGPTYLRISNQVLVLVPMLELSE